jgi:hypothetical protein
MSALWNAKSLPLGWLKFSPALVLTKIERFSKVSERFINNWVEISHTDDLKQKSRVAYK